MLKDKMKAKKLMKDPRIRQSVMSEIVEIEEIDRENARRKFDAHSVECSGRKFVSYVAKALNRALNQTGRGDFRYLLSDDGAYLAQHRPNGNGYSIMGRLQ